MSVYSFIELDTIVADASHIAWNKGASGPSDFALAETCTWGSDGLGECVREVQFPGATTTAPPETITGSKFAFVTLTVSPTSSATSITPTNTQANSAFSLRSTVKDIAGMLVIAAFVGSFMAF